MAGAVTHKGGGFEAWMQKRLDSQMKAFLIGLEDLGNRCLIEMREPTKRGYLDRTSNLRSSTGFVIVKDGKIIRSSGFDPVTSKDGNTGTEGAKEGDALAAEVASTIDNGVALVLVAGMNYAVYVERMGLNVMDSAKLLASAEVKDLVNDLLK